MDPELHLRIEALSQSVRVSLANGGKEDADATVTRARLFINFLADKSGDQTAAD